MGGYMIDAANGRYSSSKPKLFLVKSYSSFVTTDAEIYFSGNPFADKLAAIVYTGSELSADGKLYYQGYDVQDMVKGFAERRYAFEETTYLLLFGEL
ncbi:MAG: hypothetical protein II412_05830, partial [Clostridia bacterium]|nr:hypothetical protein [Clostridia bacterium]